MSLNISSLKIAPSGCLQYHYGSSGIIRSFNYNPSPNARLNSIGVDGTRQIAGLSYGICIRASSSCSITYSVLSSDAYSFTVTGDVGAVDPALLGTGTLQEQLCTTDYVIIPNPSQGGTLLTSGSDRFCGLGLTPTTSRPSTIQIKCMFNFTNNVFSCNFFCWPSFQVMCCHLWCMRLLMAMKRLILAIEDLRCPTRKTFARWYKLQIYEKSDEKEF